MAFSRGCTILTTRSSLCGDEVSVWLFLASVSRLPSFFRFPFLNFDKLKAKFASLVYPG